MPGKPLHILSSFQRFPLTWTSGQTSGTAARARGLIALLKGSLKADVILVNGDVNTVMGLAGVFFLFPFLKKPIVAVDLVLRQPQTGASRLQVRLKRALLSRVDHFIHYFRDLKGYEKYYGIGPERSSFVYFKANLFERVKTVYPTEGEYVLCFGRSLRDYDTFFDAVDRLPYPVAIPRPNFNHLTAHGARFSRPLGALPARLKLLDDDGTALSQIGLLEKARVVVIPILRQTLCASGIGTYLNAMFMGKCVIISDGPGVSDVLSDQAVWVPPENAAALSEAIRRVWEDDALRQKTALAGQAFATALGGEDALMQRILDNVVQRFYAR